jgi:hypothetical protein
MTIPTNIPAKPKYRDNFLLIILIGIGVLVALGFISIIFLHQPQKEFSANSPSAVVQSYISAVDGQDYEKAYNLLGSSLKSKISLNTFKTRQYYGQPSSISIESEKITGNTATVNLQITTTYNSGSPFGNNRYTQNSRMVLQLEGNVWRLTSLDYPYYLYYGN